MSDYDYMEMGDSNLIPQKDGTYIDKETGNKVDADGNVYSPTGELIWNDDLEEYDDEFDA